MGESSFMSFIISIGAGEATGSKEGVGEWLWEQVRQAGSKRPGMDPNIEMLEKWTSTYVWKAIVKADSLMVVYLVVWEFICIHSAVEINV